MSRRGFQSLVLLGFVSGLAMFFVVNPGRWLLGQRVTEPLVIRLQATPDLGAWLDAARARFLESSPRIARRPLDLTIAYADEGQVEAAYAQQSSAAGLYSAWIVSRPALEASDALHRRNEAMQTVIPLASTVLTAVMWEERAQQLLQAVGRSPSQVQRPVWRHAEVQEAAWQQALTSQPAGDPSATPAFRWLIPHPQRSTPGLMSFVLIGLGSIGPHQVRWPDDPLRQDQLRTWLTTFLGRVHRFRPSGRETANDFLNYGPSRADAVLLPEHLALQIPARAAERAGQGVVLCYPPVNLEYQYVLVNLGVAGKGPWQEAIGAFQRFLRSEEGQRLALEYGLRPVLPALTRQSVDPWRQFEAQGARFAFQFTRLDWQAAREPASQLAQQLLERLNRP